jgi:hypothetical protein
VVEGIVSVSMCHRRSEKLLFIFFKILKRRHY